MLKILLRLAASLVLAIVIGVAAAMLVLAKGDPSILIGLPIGVVIAAPFAIVIGVPILWFVLIRQLNLLKHYLVASVLMSIAVTLLWWLRQGPERYLDVIAITWTWLAYLAACISGAIVLWVFRPRISRKADDSISL